MGRPKIIEVEYHQFIAQLRKALNEGRRLEPSDQPAWDNYVAAREISEVAMASWGRSKFEEVEPVIISSRDWAGYYVFSTTEEAVLKWTKPDQPSVAHE